MLMLCSLAPYTIWDPGPSNTPRMGLPTIIAVNTIPQRHSYKLNNLPQVSLEKRAVGIGDGGAHSQKEDEKEEKKGLGTQEGR